jgi:type II secretory pathway pseudopilin PulG
MITIGKILKQDLRKITKNQTTNEGFSLIEATIALTTLGICLAYAMPLFLYSKLNNIKSEVRTGALMASQQIFDDIRGLPFQNIPKTATNTSAPQSTIINSNGTIASAATEDTIPKNKYTIMGRNYTAKVFYCETAMNDENECNDNYKKFRVEIKDKNNKVVYDMEAGFTNFQ